MAIDECIVHSSENASEFYRAVNQLRREKKFHADVYQQLPSQCCSCDGQTGLKTIDLNILRKICHEILLSWARKIHVPFPKNLNKLLLTKRGKSKKRQISKNAIINELRYQRNEYEEEWNEYEEDLYNKYQDGIWEERADKSKYSISQLSISLKYFNAIVAFDQCIVHDLEYRFEFQYAVQQLRRVNDFPKSIYNQLSEKCCSCNGKQGLNVIDPIILRNICYEMKPEQLVEQQLKAPVNWMSLPFGSTFDLVERHRKIGLFIGKKGRHIRAVENKYNVYVNIIIGSSSRQLRRNLIELVNNSATNKLYLLLTKMDTSVKETILINEIKKTLTEKWNKISESQHFKK